jgi:tellurite resistance protein TehA-like permease
LADSVQETVELRLRTMRTLWFALFASVGLYYAFTFIAGRSEDREPNPTLSLILIVIGVSTTLIAFVIKSKLINLAIEQQRVQLVQQAYIVAWAMTEVAALLGLLDFFATGHRHYYILFIIAAVGMVLQTPRREHVVNAWPKTKI